MGCVRRLSRSGDARGETAGSLRRSTPSAAGWTRQRTLALMRAICRRPRGGGSRPLGCRRSLRLRVAQRSSSRSSSSSRRSSHRSRSPMRTCSRCRPSSSSSTCCSSSVWMARRAGLRSIWAQPCSPPARRRFRSGCRASRGLRCRPCRCRLARGPRRRRLPGSCRCQCVPATARTAAFTAAECTAATPRSRRGGATTPRPTSTMCAPPTRPRRARCRSGWSSASSGWRGARRRRRRSTATSPARRRRCAPRSRPRCASRTRRSIRRFERGPTSTCRCDASGGALGIAAPSARCRGRP